VTGGAQAGEGGFWEGFTQHFNPGGAAKNALERASGVEIKQQIYMVTGMGPGTPSTREYCFKNSSGVFDPSNARKGYLAPDGTFSDEGVTRESRNVRIQTGQVAANILSATDCATAEAAKKLVQLGPNRLLKNPPNNAHDVMS
jgi:hypothetical protein